MLNVIKNQKKNNACESLTDNKFKKKNENQSGCTIREVWEPGKSGKVGTCHG